MTIMVVNGSLQSTCGLQVNGNTTGPRHNASYNGTGPFVGSGSVGQRPHVHPLSAEHLQHSQVAARAAARAMQQAEAEGQHGGPGLSFKRLLGKNKQISLRPF